MKVWGAIAAGLIKRGGACLISVRDVAGSTPREAGTRMVVFADGAFTGTIGGGTLEWRAIAEAQRLMAADRAQPSLTLGSPPSLPSPTRGEGREGGESHGTTPADPTLLTRFTARSYALGPELGQCCGGRMTLGYEVISPAALPAIQLFAAAEAKGPFQADSEIFGDVLTRRIATAAASGNIETFGDDVRTLVLFGAGHVGRALVLALASLPFRVIWVDGRKDAFPAAVPANVSLVTPPDPVTVLADAPADSFVLIMTHSHELDLALCDAALRSDRFPHVGVIGSATKRARFERRLLQAGVAGEAVDRLVCPIGVLGPKSKMPQVIAATTVVELLVADETCLKVGQQTGIGADVSAGADTAAWGQASGS